MYIGRTYRSALTRYNEHLRNSRYARQIKNGNGAHMSDNQRAAADKKLARAIAKHGWTNFVLTVVDIIPPIPADWKLWYEDQARQEHQRKRRRNKQVIMAAEKARRAAIDATPQRPRGSRARRRQANGEAAFEAVMNTPPTQNQINLYVKNHWAAPYENHWIDLLQAGHDCNFNNTTMDTGRLRGNALHRVQCGRRMRRWRRGNPLKRRRECRPRRRRQGEQPTSMFTQASQEGDMANGTAAARAQRANTRREATATIQGALMGMQAATTQHNGNVANRYKYSNLTDKPLKVLLEAHHMVHRAIWDANGALTEKRRTKLAQDLKRAVRAMVHKRRRRKERRLHKTDRDQAPMFICSYKTKKMEQLQLEEYLNSTSALECIPMELRTAWQRPTVAHFYGPALGLRVFSYSQVANKTKQADVQQALDDKATGKECACSRYDDRYKDRATGHVHTADLSIIKCGELRRVMCKGTTFRTPERTTRQEMKDDMEEALRVFTFRLARSLQLPHGADGTPFDDWAAEVARQTNEAIDNIKPETKAEEPQDDIMEHDRAFTTRARSVLRQLQKQFVITSVDKSAANFSIICKAAYLSNMSTETGGWRSNGSVMPSTAYLVQEEEDENGDVKPTTTAEQQCRAYRDVLYMRFEDHLLPLSTKHAANNEARTAAKEKAGITLPHSFTTSKFHKTPIKHRFVAAAGAAVSTRLSQNVGIVLTLALPALNRLWADETSGLARGLFPATRPNSFRRRQRDAVRRACRRTWITNNSTAVRQLLEELNRDPGQPYRQQHGGRPTRRGRERQRRIFRSRAKWGVNDFSTLYTALPHHSVGEDAHQTAEWAPDNMHGLILRVCLLLRKVFIHEAKLYQIKKKIPDGQRPELDNFYIIISKRAKAARWEPGTLDHLGKSKPPKVEHNERAVTYGMMRVWIGWLVNHCFLQFAGKLFRQIVGLPMGEACSGMLANWYLTSYELRFMVRLIKAGLYDVARRFLWTRRYIDDVEHNNNREFNKRRYQNNDTEDGIGIYPREFLTLNIEQEPMHAGGGRMLDLYITTNDRTCSYVCNAISQRRDTRHTARLARYPDASTLLADRSLYGIVTAEMTRYRRLSMQFSAYTELVGDMMYNMHKRGYDMQRVTRQVQRVARRDPETYGDISGKLTLLRATRWMQRRLKQDAGAAARAARGTRRRR